MIVELGQRQGDRIPGKIYLCLPGPDPNVVAGTFTLIGAARGK